MLQINALTKSRQDGQQKRIILDSLSLNLASGESISVMGDSGSGKSTLLNIIAGLENADSGQWFVADDELHKLDNKAYTAWRKKHLGIVFQQFNLIECLNVIDNILYPCRLNQNLDESWIDEISDKLGIRHLWLKSVQNISGGEQQRVAVARSVAHRPTLVLADEPTGNLDHHNALQVIDLLTDICKNQCNTIDLSHSQSQYRQQNRQITSFGKWKTVGS